MFIKHVHTNVRTRNPKLFFVSSTTKTISTTTLCYVSGTAAAACGKRRRRALLQDALEGADMINPAGITRADQRHR